ncbi:MAG: MarR family transcriptional regulator [Chloroflexi bacterium]|nr:MarR family transcriptional regulator [Chloroflexota bacterium]
MSTHFEGTAEEIRVLDTYTKLLRATNSVTARIHYHHTVGDLSDTQFGILDMLLHLGPLCQKDISDKLLLSKSNIVAMIDKLEQRGLVKRERSQEDRRYIFIHLTVEGENLVQTLFPGHVAAIVEEMSCLAADEQKELGRLCRKLGLKEQA